MQIQMHRIRKTLFDLKLTSVLIINLLRIIQ